MQMRIFGRRYIDQHNPDHRASNVCPFDRSDCNLAVCGSVLQNNCRAAMFNSLKCLVLLCLLQQQSACNTGPLQPTTNPRAASPPATIQPTPGGTARSEPPTVTAERFIDAFYSWKPDVLRALLTASTDADRVMYYQGWAEAAHYKIKMRQPCTHAPRSPGHQAGGLVCEITVTDDFGTTLGYTATDTFTLTITAGQIRRVTFAGDDPPVFNEVLQWIGVNRPEVLSGACKNYFDGGTTPAACARAVVAAARAFVRH